MISIDEYNDLINNYFLVSYADCLAYLGQKPIEVLIEMESAFMHFSVYSNEDDPEIKEENLQKAYNHIVRATLDCQKLIWLKMHELIEGLYKDTNMRKYCVNESEHTLVNKCNTFFDLAKKARTDEINNVGKSPLISIESYHELLEMGDDILSSIDLDKKESFIKYSKLLYLRENFFQLLISFIGGIAATAVFFLFV
ncbi:hypothetical protein [Methanogenium sp. MK-MG]|uniref:hypothetical protein n=1 Tax=Methanogenium sp. MK-MG TaxID=2599926 RepID=UPI0013EB5EF9|nr:hypothetical protein [Methanogenium sp. MK-MG]KAF1078014.1 hypothetical protein MKMG_01055 [Methanogenium sp. MK-MG]